MWDLAGFVRRTSHVPIICITGSNGKTTVKEMIYNLISSEYKVLKTPFSYNNKIGISLTLFQLDQSHEIMIFEIGTNSPGEIRTISRALVPDIVVITNIGNSHLELLGDINGVFEEKISVLDNLVPGGTAYLNKDDEKLKDVRSQLCKIEFFGENGDSDHLIENILKEDRGYSFALDDKVFYMPVEGEHNIKNAAAAICVARKCTMEYEGIKKSLAKMRLSAMRLEKIEVEGVTFINDAYNANPDSFRCAIDYFNMIDSSGKKIIIAGDMLELGKASHMLHEEVGRNIDHQNVDILITVGEYAASIADGATRSGMDQAHIFKTQDINSAAKLLNDISEKSDMILLKGSRAKKMEEIIKCYTTYCTP
jgi:UDP-N-acetylmuramoyl-tripeptide--D-alanyl-D-alanine ligase